MISNFEFYEQNLKNYIEQYNTAVEAGNRHGADFIFRTSIVPTVALYRKALWSGHCINPKDIYGINLVKSASVIYLRSSRKIDYLKILKH